MPTPESQVFIPITKVNDRASYVTHAGRPLLEGAAPQTLVRALRRRGMIVTVVESTHDGSRHKKYKKRMNNAAMAEMNQGSRAFFDGLAWINNQYFNGETPADITAADLNMLANTAIWLPTYLALRAQNPITPDDPDDPLPESVGLVSKGAEGIRRAAVSYVIADRGNEIVTPASVYEYSDASDTFRGHSLLAGEKEVCPAPRSFIVQSLSALMYGRPGDPSRSELGRLISSDEFEKVKKYGKLMEDYSNWNAGIPLQRYELAQKVVLLEKAGNQLQRVQASIDLREFEIERERRHAVFEKRFNRLLGKTNPNA